MSAPLAPRPLFGGAIALALPQDSIDASDLRQIPDNQEVFLFPHSDTALVLEVLELVEEGGAKDDLWEAAKWVQGESRGCGWLINMGRFHFGSIAHDNASLSSTIFTSPPSSPIPSTPSTSTPSQIKATTLAGTQQIHKFSHDPTGAPREGHEADVPDQVWIGLALWRVWIEGAAGRKKADVVLSVNVNLSAEGGEGAKEQHLVEGWFAQAVDSFKVEEFGLFGDV
ncbi:hypothetical protein L202_04649 [Cryptococcus amylolentus CBS 6039]|uniref:Mog1p/PsbP-like protein n=1 Tax=Cryptococcus amylolentus CBS 6039 TaxID=1295533 RepID=A0A1E3HMB8_9TREE|nr:hypothetical protein L202_04649 [Cryptococcus amylolentus CBS 6039]ODN77474.1 hypothetical protein L202_04649 [Cryptococcus amylolentus CBS 6039]